MNVIGCIHSKNSDSDDGTIWLTSEDLSVEMAKDMATIANGTYK